MPVHADRLARARAPRTIKSEPSAGWGKEFARSAFALLLAPLVLIILPQLPLRAGCAVALVVKPNGSVDSYSENASDAKFGHHYITVDQAVSLLKDTLKKQGITDAQLVFQSDQTGYFALAIGHADDGTIINHVGCAANPREADREAIADLKARGVTDGAVVNRFFSYGEPKAGGPGGTPH